MKYSSLKIDDFAVRVAFIFGENYSFDRRKFHRIFKKKFCYSKQRKTDKHLMTYKLVTLTFFPFPIYKSKENKFRTD